MSRVHSTRGDFSMSGDKAEKLGEILLDFANAIESACVSCKRQIAEVFGGVEPAKDKPSSEKEALADFGKLSWESKQGEKGAFEQTSEKANQNCVLWQQLKAKLKENKGFWQHNGFRYWNDMKNENVVDRRPISKS
jgi:hypothetical protein